MTTELRDGILIEIMRTQCNHLISMKCHMLKRKIIVGLLHSHNSINSFKNLLDKYYCDRLFIV